MCHFHFVLRLKRRTEIVQFNSIQNLLFAQVWSYQTYEYKLHYNITTNNNQFTWTRVREKLKWKDVESFRDRKRNEGEGSGRKGRGWNAEIESRIDFCWSKNKTSKNRFLGICVASFRHKNRPWPYNHFRFIF